MITDCDIYFDLSHYGFADITVDALVNRHRDFGTRISWRGEEGISMVDIINHVQKLPGFMNFFIRKVPATFKYLEEANGFYEFQIYAKFETSDMALMAKLTI